MADTSVQIDTETRDLLRAQAEAAGLSLKDYLARLAFERENDRKLTDATAAFRRMAADTQMVAFFDDAFGGPTQAAPHTQRAA